MYKNGALVGWCISLLTHAFPPMYIPLPLRSANHSSLDSLTHCSSHSYISLPSFSLHPSTSCCYSAPLVCTEAYSKVWRNWALLVEVGLVALWEAFKKPAYRRAAWLWGYVRKAWLGWERVWLGFLNGMSRFESISSCFYSENAWLVYFFLI